MNIDKYLTKASLNLVIKRCLEKTVSQVPYIKYKSLLSKTSYCKQKKYMPTEYYHYDMIEDIKVTCCIKGKLRFYIFDSLYKPDINKYNKFLKKNVPHSTKMKVLDNIKNRYIISKIDIYTYKDNINSFISYVYPINVIYLLLFTYIISNIIKLDIVQIIPFFTNNINTLLWVFYYSMRVEYKPDKLNYSVKYNNLLLTKLNKYVKNTNIIKIIQSDYVDNFKRYKDFIKTLKQYDNLQLLNTFTKTNNKKIYELSKKLIHTKEFQEYAKTEATKFKKYKFNDVYFRTKCKKAGILKEYEEMIKSVDACDTA